ncbi:MAG: hypothetical protein OXN96_19235 [Bryobacterales bacterium]|nr:hypothetical protein [Bryobacterales bacterium]
MSATLKLRWTKVSPWGIWVDDTAFYCVRRREPSARPGAVCPGGRPPEGWVYDAWLICPGVLSYLIGTSGMSRGAKAIAQDHVNKAIVALEAAA